MGYPHVWNTPFGALLKEDNVVHESKLNYLPQTPERRPHLLGSHADQTFSPCLRSLRMFALKVGGGGTCIQVLYGNKGGTALLPLVRSPHPSVSSVSSGVIESLEIGCTPRWIRHDKTIENINIQQNQVSALIISGSAGLAGL